MVNREFLLELGEEIKQLVWLGEKGLGIHRRCGQRGEEKCNICSVAKRLGNLL